MILPSLDALTLNDISDLINNKITENKYIEYKREFSNKDSDKTKFLCEVCAFANSAGGDLIYGIEEDKEGYPIALNGIQTSSIDKEIQKLNNLLRTGIEPKIPGIEIKYIDINNNNFIIIVRIFKSWNAPHRVSQNRQFYGRNSSGKYPLDISEIRSEFLAATTFAEKVSELRAERVIKVSSNETYQPMNEGAKLLVHLIPMQSFFNENTISISKHKQILQDFRPIISTGYSYKINIDGHICYQGGLNENSTRYVQVYRTGTIEVVADIQRPNDKIIFINYLEKKILESTRLQQFPLACK